MLEIAQVLESIINDSIEEEVLQQKIIDVIFEKGVFKPLEPVDLKEGGKMGIRIEDEKGVIRKVETSLREYNDFLPRDFNFILEKLRTDSRERFKCCNLYL